METTATLPDPPEAPDPLTPEQRLAAARDAEIGKFHRLACAAAEKAKALRERSRECAKIAHHFHSRAAELTRRWQRGGEHNG